VRSGQHAVLDSVWTISQFSKHATCASVSQGDSHPLFTLTGQGCVWQTFDVACDGPSYQPHQNVIDFFDAVVRTFKQFPTYNILAS